MSADVVALIIMLALLALGACWEWRAERDELSFREPVERKPAPFTQPLGIEPTDPMVLCPSCRGMGHHSLELVPAKPPAPVHSFTDPLGDRIDVFTWQSAAGTAEHYRRECVFCGHGWSVPT
jgi:hypothetical protein